MCRVACRLLTTRRHDRLAKAGVGMTVVAHVAVSASGRATPSDLVLTDDGVAARLAELTSAVHAAGGAVCVQLTHAGYLAAPCGAQDGSDATAQGTGMLGSGPGRMYFRNAARGVGAWTPALAEADIARLTVEFAIAARVAITEARFDAVLIHAANEYDLRSPATPATTLTAHDVCVLAGFSFLSS